MKKEIKKEVFNLKAAQAYIPVARKERSREEIKAKRALREEENKKKEAHQWIITQAKAEVPWLFSEHWVPEIKKGIKAGSQNVQFILFVAGRQRILGIGGWSQQWQALATEGCRFLQKKGFKAEAFADTQWYWSGPEFSVLSIVVSGWKK